LSPFLPVAFVYSSLFRARLNASYKQIRTQGKGVKQKGDKGSIWAKQGARNKRLHDEQLNDFYSSASTVD
jgi:hypothetical protein